MPGISALLFAYFGNVIDIYDKRSFIQTILPVETYWFSGYLYIPYTIKTS